MVAHFHYFHRLLLVVYQRSVKFLGLSEANADYLGGKVHPSIYLDLCIYCSKVQLLLPLCSGFFRNVP